MALLKVLGRGASVQEVVGSDGVVDGSQSLPAPLLRAPLSVVAPASRHCEPQRSNLGLRRCVGSRFGECCLRCGLHHPPGPLPGRKGEDNNDLWGTPPDPCQRGCAPLDSPCGGRAASHNAPRYGRRPSTWQSRSARTGLGTPGVIAGGQIMPRVHGDLPVRKAPAAGQLGVPLQCAALVERPSASPRGGAGCSVVQVGGLAIA